MNNLAELKKSLAVALPAAAMFFSGCMMEQERQEPEMTVALQVSAAAPVHGTGALKDSRQLLLSKRSDANSKVMLLPPTFPPINLPLPAAFDLTPYTPPPGDQGGLNSCVGWAVGYAAKSEQEVLEESWNRTSTRHQFSPKYIYNQINGGKNVPVTVAAALDLVVSQGVDNLESWPYSLTDYSTKPDADSRSRASRYRADSWSSLAPVVYDLKLAIRSGAPLITLIAVYPELHSLNATNDTYDDLSGSQMGNHVVTLIAYDDARQAFKFINSWGTGWGAGGYGWIPYNLIGNSRLGADVYRLNDRGNVKGFSKANHPRMTADVNNDGKLDIVTFANDGVYVSTSNGTTFNPATIWSRSYGSITGWDAKTPRVLADVNNDYKADIIGFGLNDVMVSLSTGTSFAPAVVWHTSFAFNDGWDAKTVRVVADVNLDNKADIIGFGINDVFVSLSSGSSFGPAQVWHSDFAYNDGWDAKTTRLVADVNDDKRADIIGFGYNDVYVALSTGSGFGAPQIWNTAFGVNDGWDAKTVKVVGDVNNDRKADIVGFGVNDVFVSLSTGSGFGAASLWHDNFGYTDGWDDNTVKIVGDVTGDKRADIVGFGINDVVFAAANVNGTAFGVPQMAVSRNYAYTANEWYLP
jgi:C1A family cysteine protease